MLDLLISFIVFLTDLDVFSLYMLIVFQNQFDIYIMIFFTASCVDLSLTFYTFFDNPMTKEGR